MVKTKIQPLNQEKAIEVINNFLEKFQSCVNQKRTPQATDFADILSNNFQNTTNGRQIGRNLQDLLKRIQNLKNRYSSVEIESLDDCLISDNKAIIQYNVDLTAQNGNKSQVYVMAIATIEDNLITAWDQVGHEKGKDHLES